MTCREKHYLVYYYTKLRYFIGILAYPTRTKTSIRYAKEMIERDGERERKKGTRRDIETEGEIRERQREKERERERKRETEREREGERESGQRDREVKGIER